MSYVYSGWCSLVGLYFVNMEMENKLENLSKNVLDKLENLKCPICLDIVENVRELPCRHIFCSNCLETYKKDKEGLICPLCKKETSKRKFLSHDAALDSLCRFVRTLCDDFKVHHETDIKTFFSNMNMNTVTENESNTNHSDEIITNSDENIIPCTLKPIGQMKSLKKRNGPKLIMKSTPKPMKLDIEKKLVSVEKKPRPKIILSRKQNARIKSSDNLAQFQPKSTPYHKSHSGQSYSDKNKIMQWLHDTRNKFDRISQTQSYVNQNNTPQDIDMPSVSQIYVQKNKDHISRKAKTKDNPMKSANCQESRDRRALSAENSSHTKCTQLRRHSLECTSPLKTKKYQKMQEINYIENQLIINIIEDEVLDVIDKEISGESCRKKTSLSFDKKDAGVKNSGVIHAEEDTFLDQLDNEMIENSGEWKKIDRTNLNTTENDLENKSKSSWKSIKKFRKSIGKTKIPKKLDISLQTTQKTNKKDIEIKLNTSDPSKSTRSTTMDTKIVDFQKMEEYFSKAIPEMMEANIRETSSQEIISDEDIYQKDREAHKENDIDNNSDIYIYQTQPLSKVKSDPISDKIDYATKLTNKLENIVQQLLEEEKSETKQLIPLISSIENIFNILNKLDNRKIHSSPVEKISCSEKQIQTDLLSFDAFPITPNAAFKSLIHEDVTTQTDNFCPDCPHSCPIREYNIIADKASSPIMKSKQSDENDKEYESKLGTLNESNVEPKLQSEKIQSQIKYTKINEEEINPQLLKEQISSNVDMGKIIHQNILDINNSVGELSLKYNTSNISKTGEVNPTLKIESNLNEIELNPRISLNFDTSQGSAIMCSVPQSNSRVNRRLMFEKAMQERDELGQSLKRCRSKNSISDSDEERPYKVKCNRFLQNDISIEFESETLNDDSQYLKNSVAMKESNKVSPVEKNDFISSQRTGNESGKYNKKTQHSQADTLLNYCDELIERANRQISVKTVLSDQDQENDIDLSQILSESNKEFKNSANPKLVIKQTLEKPKESNEKMKTQELLKHYDELIEKANKQIEIENVDPNEIDSIIKHNYSQIPTTSKTVEVFEEVPVRKNVMKTQDLLDHCNELIAKTTKEIARNENNTLTNEEEKNEIQFQNDDEFFYQNLDRLDSVLEKENKKVGETLSESLFASCKDDVINKSLAVNEGMVQTGYIFNTPKRQRSVGEGKNRDEMEISASKKKKADGFSSSDDEIFSDVDVVETTPQKSVCFLERLSCSQAVNQNSRGSLKIQQNMDDVPEGVFIVPPPPGFDDMHEKIESEQMIHSSERESENVIPTSLSPQRFENAPIRNPLIGMNHKHFAVPQDVPTLSQQFMKVSPICKEKSKNLNVIEIVRQSKFSPLTILPRSNTSVSTSTPKQKSILSYVKPVLKSSQEASTSTSERSKPCIAFTRLNNAETLCVISLCNKDLASRQDKFGPSVTHMIVSVDKHNYVKDHTIKFISAIAAGIWVLNIKWVQECLAKNQIVNEEPFEVLDITGIPSPRISRLTHQSNPLLKGFKFFIPRSFAQTSAEDVKNIIHLLQGVVVSSIEEMKDDKESVCIIISELVDTEDYTQYENWLMTYKIITVDINWLSLSVSRYKILSLRPHLLCSDDSIDELGYPSQLVVDVAPSLTQDVTYD